MQQSWRHIVQEDQSMGCTSGGCHPQYRNEPRLFSGCATRPFSKETRLSGHSFAPSLCLAAAGEITIQPRQEKTRLAHPHSLCLAAMRPARTLRGACLPSPSCILHLGPLHTEPCTARMCQTHIISVPRTLTPEKRIFLLRGVSLLWARPSHGLLDWYAPPPFQMHC